MSLSLVVTNECLQIVTRLEEVKVSQDKIMSNRLQRVYFHHDIAYDDSEYIYDIKKGKKTLYHLKVLFNFHVICSWSTVYYM